MSRPPLAAARELLAALDDGINDVCEVGPLLTPALAADLRALLEDAGQRERAERAEAALVAAHAAVAAYRCWRCGAPHEAAPLQPDEAHLLDLLREAAP